MIFLLEFNRPTGKLVTFRSYDMSSREKAQSDRLNLELKLNHDKIDHEVVIIEADSEEALRRTHGRYFGVPDQKKLQEIIGSQGK